MKITFSPAVGRTGWGSPVTLCSGGAESPENIQINGTSVVDMVATLAGSVQPMDRKNVSTTVSFQITNEKSTFTLSEQDLLLYYTSTINQYGLLTFYVEGDLTTPYAYMIGTITGFTHSEVGVSTIRGFSITGGALTSSAPSHAP